MDGTKLTSNAALDRVDQAVEDLEAQNESGEDGVTIRLPEQLASLKALPERVRQAMEELPGQHRPSRTKRPNRINLTDRDARLMKTRQGIMPSFNAQAVVSPLAGGGGITGMLVTAADLADETTDYGLLIPMMEQARQPLGPKQP